MVVIFIIMKHFITFISTMALLLLLAMPAFSQEITVRFIGQINGTDYCRLDRVAVINVTRNWTEMVEYPDTIIVLGSTVGANLNIAAVQGLGQNIPNPFDCETRVELSVSQREDVRIQLLDVAGKLYAEYNGSLDAGMHAFDISAANPQTYLLNATVGSRQYSIRMVNIGSGCGCSIKYAGVSGGIEAKLTSTNEFLIGDNMRYVGYTTIDGESVASAIVEQMQVISQTITLNFTHYSQPRVETLSATNITATGATLKGNVTSNGGATVTVRGFMYGTSASNLSQNVQSGSGTGNYTKALTGLSSGTTYYYKAYATNSIGTAYGDVMSFTTQTIYPPSVQTNSASNITTTGATLSGNVTSNGGATVTARGFMYGTSADNLSQSVQSGSGTGSYVANLTNLSDNTTYFYKAYATNSEGTAYGDVMSFTTEDASLPTVVTNNANVTSTGAKLNGNVTDDGGATVTERGFIYYNFSSLIGGTGMIVSMASLESLWGCSTVQCGSGTGSFSANITDYDVGTTIYYKAYATNSAGTVYGEVISTDGFTLNEHEYVDLGLPSGLLWATCNVGANTPEEYGDYFAFGEYRPKSSYTENNYNPSVLQFNDAATCNWGSEWRMPTGAEFEELNNNCTTTWTTLNGVRGRLFRGPNGNTIFLPAAGYRGSSLSGDGSQGNYWSRTRDTTLTGRARFLSFNSSSCNTSSIGVCYKGMSVRPVCEPQN